MKSSRYFPFLFAIATLFLLVSCVDFNIQNATDVDVRVLIQTPDNGRYTRVIRSQGATNTFSEHGGSYTISILPNERYVESLTALRQEISRRLFEERATLKAEEVGRLVDNLEKIKIFLAQENERDISCSGSAPDFSAVSAIISWSETGEDWEISCAVESSEE